MCVCVWKERKKSERFEGIVEVIMGRRRKRKGWKRVCVCVCVLDMIGSNEKETGINPILHIYAFFVVVISITKLNHITKSQIALIPHKTI